MRKIAVKLLAVAAATASAVALGAGSALADPPAGTTPARTDIVGVGSDTTTFLLDQISHDYNLTSPANNLYSWDALGSTNIQSKGTQAADPSCDFGRPNGSGAGINQLKAGLLTGDGTDPCVDFSRSSRATTATDPQGFAFVALAEDAISWSATDPAKGGHAPAGATLSLTQLGQIYTCQNPANGNAPYRWSDFFAGASTDAIVPILPQGNSGTRATFLTDIGSPTLGSCVQNANGLTAIEENEGTNAAFFQADGVTPNPDVLYPYSVGAYISQVDTGTVTAQAPGDLLPQNLLGDDGATSEAPISGTGSTATISLNLPANSYRTLYDVMPNTGTVASPAISSKLNAVFGASGWICTSGSTDINNFGFLSLGANCGAISPSGQ